MTMTTTKMLHYGTLLVLLGRAAARPPYPAVRFTPWDALPPDVRDRARAAGYHGKSWNKPHALAAEARDYASLGPETVTFLESVAVTAEAWDCYVNHYRNYGWDTLAEAARASYAALGWTEDLWEGDGEPEEEGKYWRDLTEAQRQAAAGVCYNQPIWDEVAIPLWKEDDGEGGEAGEQDAADLHSAQETQVVEEKQDVYEKMYDPEDQGDAAFEGPASAHNDRGIPVPFFRYEPWERLEPEVQLLAEKARYDEKSWNAIGTNKLEGVDWETIGSDTPAVQRALIELGFTEAQWDCYMAHYRTYSWGELQGAGVQQLFKDLGYSHAAWNKEVEPESFGRYWPDLTKAQQTAAYELGYFREAWDAVSLQFWPLTTVNTVALEDYAAAPPVYPLLRFTAWDALTHEVREAARAAGYHEKSWNKLHTLAAEARDYASLAPEMVTFLASLPLSAASWDCYVNHYRYYDWNELGEAAASYAALGWTADLWKSDEAPKEEGKYWEDLTDAQRQAATGVCYTQEIWDDVAIPLWSEDDGEGGEAGEQDAEDLYSGAETQVAAEKQNIYEQMYGDDDKSMAFNGPASAHNDRGIEVPFFRYVPWELLDQDRQTIAGAAGYDEKSWNAIGTNKLERMDWEAIGKKHHTVQKALRHLGFSEEQWDCYVTHYRTYAWRELEAAGVQRHFEDLGYTYGTWAHEEAPGSFGLYWPDLTKAQRDAAYQVGYFREAWDDVSLQFWPRTTANSAGLRDYVRGHKGAVGGGTAAVLVGLLLAVACGCRVAAKRRASAGGAPEVEMYGGRRFTDYSDGPSAADALHIASSGSGSEDDGYDEDERHEAKPIV